MGTEQPFRRLAQEAYFFLDPARHPRLCAVTRRTFNFLALAAISAPAALRGQSENCPNEGCYGAGPCPYECCEGSRCSSYCYYIYIGCPSGGYCWTSTQYLTCCDCYNYASYNYCYCEEHGNAPA